MKQRDAVYNAVTSVLSDEGVHFEDGMNVSELLTKEQRASVHTIVTEGFTSGSIEFADTPANQAKLADPSKLSSYVSNLISNWFRKDMRLNGNTKYTPKNPGSRVGSTDPQLKALRQLAKQFQGIDSEKFEKLQSEINTRVSAIQAERATKVEIDYSVLPADLIESLGLSQEG
jgi:hypothetical protein